MEKIIIAAVAQNGVIGADGKMPWHSREEFLHFKKTTLNFPVIMGRLTFESMGKPLKGRLNIILTSKSQDLFGDLDIKLEKSLESAVSYCEKMNYEKCFIIGGAGVYKIGMNIADRMIISYMKLAPKGDTYFPRIDNTIWKVDKVVKHSEFDVYYYERT